jgi:hypothetical protein
MSQNDGKWLFYKWWYLTAAALSAALFIAGLFGVFPLFLIGALGLVTCFLLYYRLDRYQRYYGIMLNQYRFKQWWWWIIASLSLAGLSPDTNTFLLGLFFLLLALVLLFLPPGGSRTRFDN